MKVLVDTNVWLDVLQDRKPFYEDSALALTILEELEHAAFLSATSVTTIFYLVAKKANRQTAFEQVRRLLEHYGVVAIDGAVLRDALSSDSDDYEDAVLEYAAQRAGLDAIVTRNAKDFGGSRLAIYTPAELVAALSA
ncbi:MAG: type II toxin-antitoxin system VapC family toxin [Persicimonas sp.]